MITEGKIGHVMQGQTSYYRNSDGGQWRYYKLCKDMTPKTVDWKMFLGTDFGLAPDHAVQPRQVRPVALLLGLRRRHVHRPVRPPAHPPDPGDGRSLPERVVGAGGLYLEYDGRDVPDMATVVADYDEGCQVLISATMCNDVQLPEVIRGHTGDLRCSSGSPTRASASSSRSSKGARPLREPTPARAATSSSRRSRARTPTRSGSTSWSAVRSRNPETLCPAELGYAAITTVNLGVKSYREGKAYFFDKETGKVSDADELWAKRWEEVSHKRGKPNQVIGWKAGDEGSLLHMPRYQKLEGDWVDGKDPGLGLSRVDRLLRIRGPEPPRPRGWPGSSRLPDQRRAALPSIRRRPRRAQGEVRRSRSEHDQVCRAGLRIEARPAGPGAGRGWSSRWPARRASPSRWPEQVPHARLPAPDSIPPGRAYPPRRSCRTARPPTRRTSRRQPGQRAGVADEDRARRALGPCQHAQRRRVEMMAVGDEGGGQPIERRLLPDRVRVAGQRRGDAVAQVRAEPGPGRDRGPNRRPVGGGVAERHDHARRRPPGG